MTGDEIRAEKIDALNADIGAAIWLKEIAAQLADLNSQLRQCIEDGHFQVENISI